MKPKTPIERIGQLFARMIVLGLVLLILGLIAVVLLPPKEWAMAVPVVAAGVIAILGGMSGHRHFSSRATSHPEGRG